MAQTIAMIRGTTTCANGSSVTLFTQSGGTATRVILNWVAFYVTGGTNYSSPNCNLYHTSSSGGAGVVAAWANNSGNSGGQFSGGIPSTQSGSANSVFSNVTGNYPALLQAMRVSSLGSTPGFTASNFWIGPSDTVSLSWYDNNSQNINVAYSFTTVTES